MRQECVISLWLFNLYMHSLIELEIGKSVRLLEKGRAKNPLLLFSDLVISDESEKRLRGLIEVFG